jgi:hypothetical protein
LGILVIVYGHVAGASVDHLTPPVYPKQLGVAFFLFVLGFSLARETRAGPRVVFNRLFEVYLFGVAFALLLSAWAYVRTSRLDASNYLPFLFGSNVLVNDFPANPTTWFIGTYLHALLVWALILRRVRIKLWMLVLTGLAEVLVRAALMETRGLFVAYMVLPNWASVFLLGLYYGQQPEQARPDTPTGRRPEAFWTSALCYGCGLGLLVLAWPVFGNAWVVERSFPFMRFRVGSGLTDSAVTSAAVTALYLLYTWLGYQLTRRLPALTAVRFLARGTLIVFIAHMPVYFLINAPIGEWTGRYWARVGMRLSACLLLLAVLSEVLYKVIQPKRLRDKVYLLCLKVKDAGGSWRPRETVTG